MSATIRAMVRYVHGWRRFFTRTAKAVRIVLRDGGIPRPLRWLAAFGLAPIPGPFDEIVLLLVALILLLFYRGRLREAWRQTEPDLG
jgi:hypothetical protein